MTLNQESRFLFKIQAS